MYRDAQEELKRLEAALLEEDNRQDSSSQWNIDEEDDIPDLPRKRDRRNRIIFRLTLAVIFLTTAIIILLTILLAGYGRWF